MKPIVGLIGCGKAKLDHAAPARDLYTGSLFRACRRYIETQTDTWAILSAKHGLLHPDQIIEPYDVTLIGKPATVIDRWSRHTHDEIVDSFGASRSFMLLAGRSYRGAVKDLDVWCPWDDLPRGGMFAQLAWLKENT